MSLEFKGEYQLPVALQAVWQGLNDPEVLRQSIQGCTELERVTADEFQAVVVARVGPIGVTFRGVVTLEDIEPMHAYTLVGQAKGGAAGFGRMRARITLEKIDEQHTLLRYTADAEVGGKLASVGQRLILSVAKKQADDFFAQLIAVLTVSTPVSPSPSVPLNDESPFAQVNASHMMPASTSGGLGAPVPAWLVVFSAALGIALGYCLASLP